MSDPDMGNVEIPSDTCTADKAAPVDIRSIEKVWNKVALAYEQVNLLCELRDVGVGTHMIESFMRRLEEEDIVSWGNLRGTKRR